MSAVRTATGAAVAVGALVGVALGLVVVDLAGFTTDVPAGRVPTMTYVVPEEPGPTHP